MSAPPGWHPQPDGRDRWWDGQQWSEHFREPAAPGPVEGGYGTPQGQWQQPQKSGMSGVAKGCLIGAIVLVLILVVGAIGAVFFVGRSVNSSIDDVRESIGNLPTDGPRGEPVVIVVGQGFALPGATVSDGWSVDDSGPVGSQVQGMEASFEEDQSLPVLFTMKFGDDGPETFCTAVAPDSGQTNEVTCVPLFEDVDPDAGVTVTPAF